MRDEQSLFKNIHPVSGNSGPSNPSNMSLVLGNNDLQQAAAPPLAALEDNAEIVLTPADILRLLPDLDIVPRSRQEQEAIANLIDEADVDGSGIFSIGELGGLLERVQEKVAFLQAQAEETFACTQLGFCLGDFLELVSSFQIVCQKKNRSGIGGGAGGVRVGGASSGTRLINGGEVAEIEEDSEETEEDVVVQPVVVRGKAAAEAAKATARASINFRRSVNLSGGNNAGGISAASGGVGGLLSPPNLLSAGSFNPITSGDPASATLAVVFNQSWTRRRSSSSSSSPTAAQQFESPNDKPRLSVEEDNDGDLDATPRRASRVSRPGPPLRRTLVMKPPRSPNRLTSPGGAFRAGEAVSGGGRVAGAGVSVLSSAKASRSRVLSSEWEVLHALGLYRPEWLNDPDLRYSVSLSSSESEVLEKRAEKCI